MVIMILVNAVIWNLKETITIYIIMFLFITLNTSAYPGEMIEEKCKQSYIVSSALEIIQRQKQSSIILLKH